MDVVATCIGSHRIHGKTSDPITVNIAECGILGLSLCDGSREQSRVAVVTKGAAEVFRDTCKSALERSASFRGLESPRGFAAE